MNYFVMLLATLALWACSTTENETANELSSSENYSCSGSENSSGSQSSSSPAMDSSRIWIVEGLLGAGPVVRFSYFSNDTSWLEYKATTLEQDSIYKLSGFLSWHTSGDFEFPDSTFLRGDTIQYRLGYTLDGKLDSTEWQEYVFLGNYITFRIKNDTFTVQQFDSIQYPTELGPDDSCGKALAVFIVTMSVLDTFDYEANWDTLFSDGRQYIDWFDLRCMQERNPMFGDMYLMSYEGNINEAAKAMQKINPVFFLNLVPWCSEYVDCYIPPPM